MASTSEANQARAIATTTRLKNFTQAKNIATTTPLTTSTLLQHEHGGGAPGEIKTMIAWQQQAKQIDQVLGSGARKIANSIYLFARRVELASILIKPPKVWSTLSKAKSPLLCLEIFIDYESWFVWAHDDAENQSILNVAKPPKRARVESTITAPDRSKQARKSNNFASGFSLSSANGGAARSAVSLNVTSLSIDTITGKPLFVNDREAVRALIHDAPFAQGTMKVAYELEILTKPETFVAKRFFRLDDDSPRDVALSTVSVLDNKLQIKAELVRLGWGNWFLNDFYKHCDQTGVTVCRTFADAFRTRDSLSEHRFGVQAILEGDDGIMWLVERSALRVS
ncbi:hypothetical protein HGRIS_009349 [Hohenbuehelia grisea]|uniref:Uncharacterized protein n=1 Tax=Hohenbuehelia grisea TaxID=104357 RepID=A0ABR3J195_9AGAR